MVGLNRSDWDLYKKRTHLRLSYQVNRTKQRTKQSTEGNPWREERMFITLTVTMDV